MAIRKGIIATVLICVTISVLFTIQTFLSFAAENPNDIAVNRYERVIAHGGGAYKGFETTNSVEALNHAVKNGYKMIELDMELSSDHKIIMLHDWDRTARNYYGTSFQKKITQNKFLKLSVYGTFEVLTFEKLASILEKNQDVRIISDTKGDNLKLLTVISENFPNLVKRIIPQIYDYDQYSKVKELGYSDIIITLYALPDLDLNQLLSFVKNHDIYAVTIPDYLAERGICRQVSDEGIKVYVHPVSSFEDAQYFMEQGAYGVYSGTLLPEEFRGFETDYYLTVTNGSRGLLKLTDERINDWSGLQTHGLKTGETVSYFIDNSSQSFQGQDLSELKLGKHKLTLKIYGNKELLGSLDYFLWKDMEDFRILHKKYEYRIDAVEPEKNFDSVITKLDVPSEIRAILKQSLIAKKGESFFYNNGKLEKYRNGEEFLPVQTGGYGKLLLPLNTTAKELGAVSVTMNQSKDISILYREERSQVMVDSCLIRKGYRITKIKTPVVLYLNKAMAGGELYQCITGRTYFEKDGMLVILPKGIKSDENQKNQILKSVKNLF